MRKLNRPLVWFLMGVFLAGCAATIPHTIVPDYGKRGIRLIAVMPILNNSSDKNSAGILRTKLLEEMYFKGYPKIPLRVIDEKIGSILPGNATNVAPQKIGEMLNVDAVLYTTLTKSGMGSGIIYGSTTVEAKFTLRSAKTGETLWHVDYRTAHRSYGFSRKMVELKSSQVYESAIHEVVNRALETLPDGPDLLG